MRRVSRFQVIRIFLYPKFGGFGRVYALGVDESPEAGDAFHGALAIPHEVFSVAENNSIGMARGDIESPEDLGVFFAEGVGFVGEQDNFWLPIDDFLKGDAGITGVALANLLQFQGWAVSYIGGEGIATGTVLENIPRAREIEHVGDKGVAVDGHEGVHPDGDEGAKGRFGAAELAGFVVDAVGRGDELAGRFGASL